MRQQIRKHTDRSDLGNLRGYSSNYRDSAVGRGLTAASYKPEVEVKGTHLRDLEKSDRESIIEEPGVNLSDFSILFHMQSC